MMCAGSAAITTAAGKWLKTTIEGVTLWTDVVASVSWSRLAEQCLAPRSLMRGWLLVLLHHQPAHGYELGNRLASLQFDSSKTRVYRNLRWLQDAGYVHQDWEATGRGPARRVYRLSDDGLGVLELLTPHLRLATGGFDEGSRSRLLAMLDTPLAGTQTFAFTVSARMRVCATTEDTARRKVERMLRRAARIDPSVRAEGAMFVGCPIELGPSSLSSRVSVRDRRQAR